MRHARWLARLLVVSAATGSMPFGAGCIYDWEIGAPAALDGGTEAGEGGGGTDAGPDCVALQQTLDEARLAAKACTIGAAGQCSSSIVDECGCASYVRDPASAQANAFSAAVDAVLSAGCAPSCGPSCTPGMTGTCLYNAGQGPYCLP